ncbi:secondary thiamine-phosphate synthase enzyme YjbQ [Sphingobium sp. CECT 9361]|uniref:secondary thiamine-phosphate synthase enzyme YjbQ n=1 Tax=Sphingobium sp. CECT 9361 TaxID=2845384 RepID=UPI001E32D44F|nr:secondary thiamine-phosphate synthase enzyme YjbQ [Sphingobium sp. CECT 9361]CAH0355583.1 hypothetical protein SPH9361_03635 [Sphingobium sp. CECT 9361]
MRQTTMILTIETPGQGLHEVTRPILRWVHDSGIVAGLLTIFCQHTSASLLIQENAAPAARRDLEAYFAWIAPEDAGRYDHDDEGPDDMPAHLRAALTHVQLTVPVINRAPALGTWQGIYLFEHRRAAHTRHLALHLMGE